MSLSGEVLPQLLSSAALSAQPDAQGGLRVIRKGTGDSRVQAAADLFVLVSKCQNAVYL